MINKPAVFGYFPISIKWNIVRGDTGVLSLDFLNNDEVSYFDISGWEFVATAYNPRTDTFDELEVEVVDGNVTVVAPSDLTETWGTSIIANSAELTFDVQATKDDGTVWTPISGQIAVLGSATGGNL